MRPELNVTTFDMKEPEDGKIRYKEYGKDVYKIEALDPYGHWFIKAMRGVTPKDLEGSFTMLSLAEQKLESYMKKREEKKVNG